MQLPSAAWRELTRHRGVVASAGGPGVDTQGWHATPVLLATGSVSSAAAVDAMFRRAERESQRLVA